VLDINPLAHRYYLADIERSARSRPRGGRKRVAAAARAIEAARRLLVIALRSGEARRA
jgi:hypothetical protein